MEYWLHLLNDTCRKKKKYLRFNGVMNFRADYFQAAGKNCEPIISGDYNKKGLFAGCKHITYAFLISTTRYWTIKLGVRTDAI